MLVTCCPFCKTKFRVTNNQLELRKGMVRCGVCREIFNGKDNLIFENQCEDVIKQDETENEDLSDRMTLIDFSSIRSDSAESSNMQTELDELSKAINDLQSKPWNEESINQNNNDFIKESNETENIDNAELENTDNNQIQSQIIEKNKVWKNFLIFLISLLLIVLIAQILFLLRNEIAANSKLVSPYIHKLCKNFGCEIKLPKNLKSLTLKSSQLDAISDEKNGSYIFTLNAVLENKSNQSQSWPSLDLRLKDDSGIVVIKKDFSPKDYIENDKIDEGFSSNSTYFVKINFELFGEPLPISELTLFYP